MASHHGRARVGLDVQPLTAGPRVALSAAQVTRLVRDAPGLKISAGAELLDRGLNVLEDVTDVLVAGSVQRQSYADLHGSGTLVFERDLDWGAAIVRPYIVLADGSGLSARFNLGAYYTSTPKRVLGVDPPSFEAACIDILDGLNDPVGETYSVAAGTAYLTAIEAILLARGFTATAYAIDQVAAATTLPSSKVWPLDNQTTWLSVVNDMLGAIGYLGVWSDWDGRLRLHPYLSPTQRAGEWTYTVDLATSMLAPQRTIERDWYRVPNRWVFYRTNNVDGPSPVEGDGVYTVTNQADGPTSIEGRGGRVITKVTGLDVANQAALIASAQVTIDADIRLRSKLSLGTAPNPLHWHFDRVTVIDPGLGAQQDALVSSWTLPLDGSDMGQEWTLL